MSSVRNKTASFVYNSTQIKMKKGNVYYIANLDNGQFDYGDEYENYYNSNYIYFDEEMHNEFVANIYQNTITYAVLLTIWTLFANLILIGACVGWKQAILRGYHAQLINLCVSNLVIAVYIIPLTIYHILGTWNFGELMCKVYVIADVIVPFTSVLIIILLNIDRVIAYSHPNLYTWMFEGSFKNFIITLPWLTSLTVVVPIWTSGTIPYDNQPGQCVVLISQEAAIVCPIITFFVPLVTLVALSFKLITIRLKATTRAHLTIVAMENIQKNEINPDARKVDNAEKGVCGSKAIAIENTELEKPAEQYIVTTFVVSISFCLLWLPYHYLGLHLSFCYNLPCVPSNEIIQLVTWLGTSSAGVTPLILLLDRHIRESLFQCCCTRATNRKEQNEQSHSEETFL